MQRLSYTAKLQRLQARRIPSLPMPILSQLQEKEMDSSAIFIPRGHTAPCFISTFNMAVPKVYLLTPILEAIMHLQYNHYMCSVSDHHPLLEACQPCTKC